MSTKSSIEYDRELGAHFYRECFEDDAVYLELEGQHIGFEIYSSERGQSVTIRIPNAVWDLICKKDSKEIFERKR